MSKNKTKIIILNKDEILIESNFYIAIEKLTNNLKKSYAINNRTLKKKLAVLVFVNENGKKSKLGELISNNIQLKIFDPNIFVLLERERIDSLLSEHEFNQTGLVSGIDSKKLGQLLGSDLVLVGTVSFNKIENNLLYYLVLGRIVDLESGEIVAINSINVLSNDGLFEKFNSEIEKRIKNIAGIYKLALSDIIVSNQKADGRNWDIMTPPDIWLHVKTSLTNTIKSKIFRDQNKINEEFLSYNIILGKNDFINILVYDFDKMESDLIGNLIITEHQIIEYLNQEQVIMIKKFDQVISLSIKLEKIKP